MNSKSFSGVLTTWPDARSFFRPQNGDDPAVVLARQLVLDDALPVPELGKAVAGRRVADAHGLARF